MCFIYFTEDIHHSFGPRFVFFSFVCILLAPALWKPPQASCQLEDDMLWNVLHKRCTQSAWKGTKGPWSRSLHMLPFNQQRGKAPLFPSYIPVCLQEKRYFIKFRDLNPNYKNINCFLFLNYLQFSFHYTLFQILHSILQVNINFKADVINIFPSTYKNSRSYWQSTQSPQLYVPF